MTMRTTLAAIVALALTPAAGAVSLGTDGLGQALIYPYFTAQSSGGNPFNTYLSVVNHTSDAKALRVRFREGRLAKEVFSANVYLSGNDVWTAAVVPAADGARLVSADRSCADPALAQAAGLAFHSARYAGDGAGDDVERMREGFVEILEMATLTGASATAVTHTSAGVPANCAAVTGSDPVLTGAPSGGLSGTLTLINVASGLDFTVNAEALADLATTAFHRGASDPYPDFNAAEIAPVSLVHANGAIYRSSWSRPVDAVSAVLMRSAWLAEYVLDAGTRSLTDIVITFPTRHFYATAASALPPFSAPAQYAAKCQGSSPWAAIGERFEFSWFNREERTATAAPCDFGVCPPDSQTPPAICAASAVGSVRNGAAHMPAAAPSSVLGSSTQGVSPTALQVSSAFENGWIRALPMGRAPLASLPNSLRVDVADGRETAGPHAHSGLPMVGFSARIFRNGTLACDAGSCQGNYGGAFPLKYRRAISP